MGTVWGSPSIAVGVKRLPLYSVVPFHRVGLGCRLLDVSSPLTALSRSAWGGSLTGLLGPRPGDPARVSVRSDVWYVWR